MNSFKNKTISQFLKLLSSGAPTPGGGSAAGIGGAIAAGLVCMVANLTIGKKGYESAEKASLKVLKKAKKYKQELLRLADEDSCAYERVLASYKLPKQNQKRKKQIQLALKYAVEVPIKTANYCQKVADAAIEMETIGNKNALSDAKSAEYLAIAAKKSALENIKINLPFIFDEKWKKNLKIFL